MSRTPAATLARVKVTYAAWAIRQLHADSGRGPLQAVHRDHGQVVHAGTPEQLEVRLFEASERRGTTR